MEQPFILLRKQTNEHPYTTLGLLNACSSRLPWKCNFSYPACFILHQRDSALNEQLLNFEITRIRRTRSVLFLKVVIKHRMQKCFSACPSAKNKFMILVT